MKRPSRKSSKQSGLNSMHGNSKEAEVDLIVRAVEAHVSCGTSYFDDFRAPIFFDLSKILINIQTQAGRREIRLSLDGGRPNPDLESLLPFAQAILQDRIN